ncbi:hypothetical protein D3C72_1967320 [compost metagenome]
MSAELGGQTHAEVVIVTFGVAAVIDRDLGLVVEAIELGHSIEVVARFGVEPGGIGTEVITVDRAGATLLQVQVRLTVAGQSTDQPLAVAPGQTAIGP